MRRLGLLAWALSLAACNAWSLDAAGQAHDPAARPFQLINQNAERVSDQDFRGRWLLVYFGFTSCPDVCPLSLTELTEAIHLLGPDASRLRVVFISIDPQHDTPRVLSRYLANFSKSFVGLTGSTAEIAQVLATFDAYASAGPKRDDGHSTIEHSSSFYMLDPRGRFQRRLSAEMKNPALSSLLRMSFVSDLAVRRVIQAPGAPWRAIDRWRPASTRTSNLDPCARGCRQ